MDELNIERLRLAMDTSDNGFWDWDLDTNEIFFSDRYFEMLGYQHDELPMKVDTWVKLLHPDDRDKLAKKLVEKVHNAEPFETEFRMRCKNGSYKWISGKGKVYEKDKDGVPHRAVGVHVDITLLKEAQERIDYQNRVLRAIRNVNQLITKEKNKKILIKKVCEILTESHGYLNTWIVLFDENGDYVASESSFNENEFAKMKERFENNELPLCGMKALKIGGLVVTDNTEENCIDCSISNLYNNRGVYTIALKYEEKIHGLLSVSVPKKYIEEQDEKDLFKEVADDISFALHNLKKEKERKKIQNDLINSETKVRKKLNSILSSDENFSNFELTDILDVESIQKLIDNLNEVFDIAMALLDVNGNVLVESKWQDICTKFHRVNSETARNCFESDTILTKDVKKGEFKEYKCKNNMYDISTPIIIGDKHLGNIYVGQFLYLDEEINYDLFKEQAKKYGFDEKEYIKALEKIPRRSRKFISNVMSFYTNLSNMIASMGYNNLKLARKINEEKKIHKKLQESEEKFRVLFSSMTEGVCIHELVYNEKNEAVDYRIIDVNPEYENILGLNKDDVLNQLASDVYSAKVPPYFDIYKKVAQTGIPEKFETYYPPQEKHFIISAFSPGKNKFATIFQDITFIKKAEEETKKLNKELNNKNAELEQVLYATSHDLRSPLVNVQGFNKELEMSLNEIKEITENEKIPYEIKEKLESILNEDIPESMHYIVSSTSKMDALLSGLLQISRVGRQRLSKKELNMNEVIKEVVDNLEYKIKERKVDIEIEELPECIADNLQMNQLFTNLIENSIKNLSNDRRAKIKIYGSADDKFVNYTVHDNGIGVPENFKDRIFELFYKINPDKTGIGLGLSIVKQIIKKHNGKIIVDSKEGKETKITFSIPRVSGGE